jgi:two-component system NtrC family response regulator
MILIVDDDPSVVASLGLLLKRHGHATLGAQSQEEALRSLEKEGDGVGLVLQDMNFSRGTGGEEGLELLREIRRRRPNLPVILITAWGSIALVVEGMKAGAADFVTKPWNNAQILQSVETALSLARAEEAKAAPASREELDRRYDFGALIGRDPRFLKILELIARVAPTDASVLITGESGTGKELVAEAIHRNSRRRAGPFVKVNLGGISSTLFESELFGHVKGAFTDARADRKGRFELAQGGTVFLDEIGELDLSAQVKLLRVLQDRSFEVLGSSITRTVEMRVVSATNRNLGEQVAKSLFREDLLYRLNLIAIHLPALRERRGDVPLLARHYLAASAKVYRGDDRITISDRAMDWLQAQSWPGNIRQLRQTLERAVLVLDGDALEVKDLLALSDLESRAARETNALPTPGSMTLDEMEKAMIVKCLQHYEGNVTRVAEALGLSRAALYRRFEKYGLQP